jgi:dihydropteroate synthase
MFTLNCRGRLVTIERPLVMGILNITPDSFYSNSRVQDAGTLTARAGSMLADGADILDIGGQSTRPGSDRVNEEEEMKRVIPAIEVIVKDHPSAIISIDTFYSSVASSAITAGASIVNDISGGSIDEKMISTVAKLQVPYILMHMKGDPKTMQDAPQYNNVTIEVLDFFVRKVDQLKLEGITDIMIDPGFGFGKSIEHNFTLLNELSVLKMLDRPILAGLSRKSTIYKTLNISVEESLNGTTVLNTIALMNGASILRVHDVKEAKQAVTLYMKCQ